MNRDQKRMAAKNMAEARKTQQWAEEAEAAARTAEVAERATKALPGEGRKRPPRRPKKSKAPVGESQPSTAGERTAPSEPPAGRGLKESPPKDEPLWDMEGFTASTPRNQLWGINYDFSSFPLVCEATFEEMLRKDPRLRRQMPFCAFQHVMTEYLNAALIDKTLENAQARFPGEYRPRELITDEMMVMPEDIAVFIEAAVNTSTPAGDEVRFNLPTAGTPMEAFDIVAPIPAIAAGAPPLPPIPPIHIPSGSFGVANAAQHNAYECYVSPLVTSGLVTATVAANLPNPPQAPWQPLPEQLYPAGGVPNRNLLGWRPPERLQAEGLNQIQDVQFADGTGLEARLRHSPELMARVTAVLLEKERDFKIRKGWPANRASPSNLAFTVTTEAADAAADIARMKITVRSPFSLSSALVTKTALLAQRRQRTAAAPGPCYTVQGDVPDGWAETRNANFHMTVDGGFGPVDWQARDDLWAWRHTAVVPAEDRYLMEVQWIRAKFVPRGRM